MPSSWTGIGRKEMTYIYYLHALQDSSCVVNRSVACTLGLIRKNKPSLLQEIQLSGSSSVDAIVRCLSEYFQKQFKLSDIITLQTGHAVGRVSFWSFVVAKPVYCSVGSCVVVLYIIKIDIVEFVITVCHPRKFLVCIIYESYEQYENKMHTKICELQYSLA